MFIYVNEDFVQSHPDQFLDESFDFIQDPPEGEYEQLYEGANEFGLARADNEWHVSLLGQERQGINTMSKSKGKTQTPKPQVVSGWKVKDAKSGQKSLFFSRLPDKFETLMELAHQGSLPKELIFKRLRESEEIRSHFNFSREDVERVIKKYSQNK